MHKQRDTETCHTNEAVPMTQAANLVSVTTDFKNLAADIVAQHNGNKSVTVNLIHQYYNNSEQITYTAAHEVIGHVSDANKTPQTAEERVLQQGTSLTSDNDYTNRAKEKSGFYSGGMMEKYQYIIKNSTLAK